MMLRTISLQKQPIKEVIDWYWPYWPGNLRSPVDEVFTLYRLHRTLL